IFITTGFSDEIELSQYYLRNAFDSYNLNEYKSAEEYLNKSMQYYKNYPEQYYLKNLIIVSLVH
ncbi:MAG: hypothetical protein OQK29_07245, partial [Ignavibacteriaceae bacterium]|nr:hypothetical protein [Ignavibacteriaceae bacterium]